MTDDDWRDRTSSATASEVTTLRRYIEMCVLLLLFFFLYPWVYSSQGLKAKIKIKAGVTIGPERRRSRKCRAEEQS